MRKLKVNVRTRPSLMKSHSFPTRVQSSVISCRCTRSVPSGAEHLRDALLAHHVHHERRFLLEARVTVLENPQIVAVVAKYPKEVNRLIRV